MGRYHRARPANHSLALDTTTESQAFTASNPAIPLMFPSAPQPPPHFPSHAITDDTLHRASPSSPADSILRAVAARCDGLRETAFVRNQEPDNGAGLLPLLPGARGAQSSSCSGHRVHRQRRRSASFRNRTAPALVLRHRSGPSSVLSLCLRGRGSALAVGGQEPPGGFFSQHGARGPLRLYPPLLSLRPAPLTLLASTPPDRSAHPPACIAVQPTLHAEPPAQASCSGVKSTAKRTGNSRGATTGGTAGSNSPWAGSTLAALLAFFTS